MLEAWKTSTGCCAWVKSRQAMYKFLWVVHPGTQDSSEMRFGWGAGMSWLPVTEFCMTACLVGLLLCSVSEKLQPMLDMLLILIIIVLDMLASMLCSLTTLLAQCEA